MRQSPDFPRTPNEIGRRAEMAITETLRSYGRVAKRMKYHDSYDLLVDGWRVEIKASSPITKRNELVWKFNIHHAGKLKETADLYIFRLENIPYCGRKTVHLLYRAPLNVKVVTVSFRQLMNNNLATLAFYDFAKGLTFPKVEVAA